MNVAEEGGGCVCESVCKTRRRNATNPKRGRVRACVSVCKTRRRNATNELAVGLRLTSMVLHALRFDSLARHCHLRLNQALARHFWGWLAGTPGSLPSSLPQPLRRERKEQSPPLPRSLNRRAYRGVTASEQVGGAGPLPESRHGSTAERCRRRTRLRASGCHG